MNVPVSTSNARPPVAALTALQVVIMILFGATLWFAAAVLLRWMGTVGALDGAGRAALYAAFIPGTVPFVLLARYLAKIPSDQTFSAYTVATASALLLDGIAVAWFPGLYGADAAHVTLAAAAVLWGAGVGLCLAFLMNRSSR